jgi:hypothetical protein
MLAMKAFCLICSLVCISLFNSCNKHEPLPELEPKLVVKSIPEADRFIFSKGDQLIYSCTDATMDTVLVNDVEFYTNSYSEEGMFGRQWDFRIDHHRISLELKDTSWLRILHYACYNPEDCNSCVNMETSTFLEEIPTTHAYFGCEPYGGLVFTSSVTAVDEVTFTGRNFQKVYSWNHSHSEHEGFRMHWSLKYGIIRFEGEIGESYYSWDLVIPES